VASGVRICTDSLVKQVNCVVDKRRSCEGVEAKKKNHSWEGVLKKNLILGRRGLGRGVTRAR
jgi:hypothetical protein